jgi:hypothetical protein
MRAVIVCVVGLLSLSSLPEAQAKNKEQAREKVAKKACAAGDFRKGVEILADLYVDTDDAIFIFNQGRCYEQNHQWANAVDRFREYLLKAEHATEDDRNDANKHLADCKRYLAADQPASSAPPAFQPSPTAAAGDAAPPPARPTDIATTPLAPNPPTAPQASSGTTMRVTGVAVAVAGAGILGAAVGLNLKANQLARDASRTQDPGTESTQKSYKTGSMVCYGVSAAALVTGGLLYWLGHEKGEPKSAGLALLPAWTPGEATITLRGGF